MQIGAPDASLTAHAGMVAVSELVARLGVISSIDAAVGPIKKRTRGFGLGQCSSGWPARSWPGRTTWSAWTRSGPTRPGRS